MIIYNYYFAILILAIFFFFISTKNSSILLALIIIIIISYYYFNKIQIYNDKKITTYKNKVKLIENAFNDRKEIITSDYIFKSFPTEIKYLNQQELADGWNQVISSRSNKKLINHFSLTLAFLPEKYWKSIKKIKKVQN